MTPPRTALVTGASAGIGAAFARVFAAKGFDLVLVARREDRLRALAASLSEAQAVRVRVIASDLAEPGASTAIAHELSAAGVTIDALVNNAGFGVRGSFHRSSWERQQALLQVLVTAPVELCHRLVPGMISRHYGRIVNVASLAGLLPAAGGTGMYGAAKAFLVRFSQALALETSGRGVHVTALCPGFTRTEFHDAMGVQPEVERLPRFMWSDADTVAREGFDAVMAGRTVHITGLVNKGIAALGKLLPERLVVALMTRRRTADRE